MPIQLTTPYDMGDIDADYTHAKIRRFTHDTETKNIELTVDLGTVSGGVFTRGQDVLGKTVRGFTISGEDYDAMIAKLTSAEDVPIYDEVARELYQYLLDEGHFIGTIV